MTVLGLVVALGTLGPAAAGGRWPLLAVLLVALSGLVDNLDGAVAVMTGVYDAARLRARLGL